MVGAFFVWAWKMRQGCYEQCQLCKYPSQNGNAHIQSVSNLSLWRNTSPTTSYFRKSVSLDSWTKEQVEVREYHVMCAHTDVAFTEYEVHGKPEIQCDLQSK